MEVSGQFQPPPLYPRGNCPPYPLDRADLDGVEKRGLLLLQGFEFLESSFIKYK
jgi:hypothetical protein